MEGAAGTRDLREMHGLGRKIPVTAATCLVGSLSLAGIPPLNGFWSKLIIVVAGIRSGHIGWAILTVVFSIVALAYQLKVQKYAFYSSEDSTVDRTRAGADAEPNRFPEPIFVALPMILLAIGCFAGEWGLRRWKGLP